ncbi:hypothetical protein TW84_10615 [Vibrio neptunius]|uniref:DsbA family protein n=1 Tax=Vibrio neptunius TaxID=170651 RepID=UPI0005FA27E9|nr:DsbA family protein [Vibrio neptunius]KJY90288.1 hypothetical protein TW84_10615 [Vibrio neptunius]
MIKILYIQDTLCGWCFGLIPALRQLKKVEPDIEVEVIPGGLFADIPSKPYSTLVSHIRSAEMSLEQVTGQKPSQAFHQMISASDSPALASSPPAKAILEMKSLNPDVVLEFAHQLQEAHYTEGRDLNLPETYDQICSQHGWPKLDTTAIVAADKLDVSVANSYQRARELGVNGYPTILIADDYNRIIGSIDGVYQVEPFIREVQKFKATALA